MKKVLLAIIALLSSTVIFAQKADSLYLGETIIGFIDAEILTNNNMKIPIFVGISDGSIKTVLAQTSIEGRDKIKERSKNLGYGEYLEIRATWSHGYHSWLTETWIPGKYTISVVKLKKIT